MFTTSHGNLKEYLKHQKKSRLKTQIQKRFWNENYFTYHHYHHQRDSNGTSHGNKHVDKHDDDQDDEQGTTTSKADNEQGVIMSKARSRARRTVTANEATTSGNCNRECETGHRSVTTRPQTMTTNAGSGRVKHNKKEDSNQVIKYFLPILTH